MENKDRTQFLYVVVLLSMDVVCARWIKGNETISSEILKCNSVLHSCVKYFLPLFSPSLYLLLLLLPKTSSSLL